MKKILAVGIWIGTIILTATVVSCNKKEKKDLSAIEEKLRDSLDQRYKKEELGYVYYDSIPVYTDKTEKELAGYLPFCDKVYIDTLLEPFTNRDSFVYVGLTYITHGEVKKAFTKQHLLARGMVKSKKDSSLLFICNYLEPKGDFCAAEIIAVKDSKKVASYIPDDSVSPGYYLDMFLVNSTGLKDVGEVIFFNSYYPACGYLNQEWFLSFKPNQFGIISYSTTWADAPYWMNTTVYLPFETKTGMVMANWSPYYTDTDGLVTDTNKKIITYLLPEEYSKDMGRVIYQETRQSFVYEDPSGNAILDENGEEKLGEAISRKEWLKWNGTSVEVLKVDTHFIKFDH